jgi:hypothetical protein
LKLVQRLEGEQAVATHGVCSCERATMLNQIWNIVQPDILLPSPEGKREFTLYVVCGLCGGPAPLREEE